MSVVLPATRQRCVSRLYPPAEAGTRFSDPGGMQGWVDLWTETVTEMLCKHYVLTVSYTACREPERGEEVHFLSWQVTLEWRSAADQQQCLPMSLGRHLSFLNLVVVVLVAVVDLPSGTHLTQLPLRHVQPAHLKRDRKWQTRLQNLGITRPKFTKFLTDVDGSSTVLMHASMLRSSHPL